MMWNNWGFGPWMIIGMILMVVFWGGVIALIVWAITKVVRGQNSGAGVGSARSALDIAKERYARGEITKEQYEQLKKDLI
jgi:putative membrane protein